MTMWYVKGDLIKLARKGNFDVIAHGCNCFCTMGAGVARAIAAAWPEAFAADAKTIPGDINKLGTITRCAVAIEDGKTLDIVNCYTQYKYGPGRQLDYGALEDCFRTLAEIYAGMRIGLPHIGAGLGGGDWETVEGLIESWLDPYCHVTIVELP